MGRFWNLQRSKYINHNDAKMIDRWNVKYRYGNINIGMPVSMDDIATGGKAEHVRKGIKV